MCLQNAVDHHGVFGDFKVLRNVTTKEGCTVCCKYMVHYDKLHDAIQLAGRRKGMKCVLIVSWPAQ